MSIVKGMYLYDMYSITVSKTVSVVVLAIIDY